MFGIFIISLYIEGQLECIRDKNTAKKWAEKENEVELISALNCIGWLEHMRNYRILIDAAECKSRIKKLPKRYNRYEGECYR
jgi:hypothetical protein